MRAIRGDANPYADFNSDCNSDTKRDTHGYRNRYANCYRHFDGQADTNTKISANAEAAAHSGAARLTLDLREATIPSHGGEAPFVPPIETLLR